jgi:hypothetical protein
LTGPGRADRTEVAGLGAEAVLDLGLRREAEAALQARELAGLDLVEAWSPRTSSSQTVTVRWMSPLSSTASTGQHQRLHGRGQRQPSSLATSSQRALPGVGVFASGCAGAARRAIRDTASASSMLAA